MPVISATTNARSEGYFRLEWRLADQRTHLMGRKAFVVPVCIDNTSDVGADVPDSFLGVQWTRLPNGEVPAAFVERVKQLLVPQPMALELAQTVEVGASIPNAGAAKSPRVKNRKSVIIVSAASVAALIALAIYYATLKGSPDGTTATLPSGVANPTASPAINPLSIMVMPFANQTGDAQKAYIADALTNSITDDLARIQDAFIVSTATAYSLQDKKLTIPQLGKEAAVRFVLNGGVTSDGEKLRIRAALSDTQSGAQLWTENFDGSKANLFALQDQVTARIGNSIGQQMVIVAARDSEKRASTPKVADLLMRARAIYNFPGSLKGLQTRVSLCRQALAIDPASITAKALLAGSLAVQADIYADELKLDKATQVARAKQAADLAREVNEIDPTIPTVYTVIAIYAGLTGDQQGNVQAERRRVELQPKSIGAHNALGVALLRMGDARGGKMEFEQALQFASMAMPPALVYRNLSWASFMLDQPDEAIVWAQKAVTALPFAASHRALALAYALKGDQMQARKAAAEAVRLNPRLRLDIADDTPWLGKEVQYRKYIETKYLPAWRLAGLPE